MRLAKLDAQFNRLHISHKDFLEARSYLLAYDANATEILRRTLIVSAIVAYARPFTKNNSGSENQSISTMPTKSLDKLTPSERALHDTIMRLRHEAVAHSDYDRKPSRRVGAIGTGFLAKSRPFDVLSERIETAMFTALCEKMDNYCTGKLHELSAQIEAHPAVLADGLAPLGRR